MTSGYQIYIYDERFDKCFRSAGLINWFPTYEESVARRTKLLETWGKYGVQYVIVDCNPDNRIKKGE